MATPPSPKPDSPVRGPLAQGGGMRPWRRFRIWPLLLACAALFAFNYWAAGRAVATPERVRVPYSPFFLEHVRAGNVRSIVSTGTAVQGTFRRAVRYPAGPGGTRTTEFSTEIPEFADTTRLSRLL